jgi:hypothetical protein
MKKQQHLVPITRRALVQRVGRALEKKGERLVANIRPGPAADIGNHYTVDINRKFVVQTHLDDLEALGKKLGVLKPYERVDEEEKK